MTAPPSISRRTLICSGTLTLALMTTAPPLQAAKLKKNEQLVHDAANQVLKIIRNGSSRQDFAVTVDRYVAVRRMALFALGKHRRKFSKDQVETYVGLFNDMLLDALVTHGRKIKGKGFVVTKSQNNIVYGYIAHNNERTTKVEFRTKKNRITDVRVQGFWLAFTLRHSYGQLIEQNGNKLEPVLEFLKSGKLP